MIHAASLKKFRQLKAVKQQTIAKKLGISQQAYAKIENGKNINKERLEDLLQAMDCSKQDWEHFISFYPPPR